MATAPSALTEGARTEGLAGPAHVAVAYSGGRDSSALLHATVQVARTLDLVVHALHVHHGLSRHADDWWRHCESTCAAYVRAGHAVQFEGRRVTLPRHGAAGVEAAAREARYRALAEMAQARGCTAVLLAHHRRDQAETFLLQALRGAGAAGLSAMPRVAVRAGLAWLRPWLDLPGDAIERYVRHEGLRHVDDDSNSDTRLARNRLRHAVWPALQQAFPEVEQTLALSARWAQEAQACLSDLARADLEALAGPGRAGTGAADPGQQTDHALMLSAVMQLPVARARNLLRLWVAALSGSAPGAAVFEAAWTGLQSRGGPRRWSLGPAGELRLYRDQLRWVPAASLDDESPGLRPEGPAAVDLPLRRAGIYRVPGWGGRLQVERVGARGVALAALAGLQLRPRIGGEQFQSAPRSVARALKKQFQSAGVPPWEREAPLGYVGGQLVFVPGLGIDARAWAGAGEAQVSLSWLPEAGD